MEKVYACIDLKSFYASVECVERNLNPLATNLVVADSTRTEKTICLAVSPSLKQYGIGGRARLFEVVQKVKEVNRERKRFNHNRKLIQKSYLDNELKRNRSLELDYIIAPPQMKKYMKYSTNIYQIYLKYLAPEDIYSYSIDEVFCDIINYLKMYHTTPEALIMKMIQDVYKTTGITATSGIGSNMYLAKIAMDITAKHMKPNEYGVRLSKLDEITYRKTLWTHKPLTDFWRIGKGVAKKLEENKMYTMGDIARMSLQNENLLYQLFGVNAELIIDHAWGYEPITMKQVKEYRPKKNSISSGQVLHCAYDYQKTKLIIREMIDLLSLELVEKNIVTNQLVLTIGYDIDNLKNPKIHYQGEITKDQYGRSIPKPSHGTIHLDYYTSSSQILTKKGLELLNRIIHKNLLVKRVYISACNLSLKAKYQSQQVYEQLDLFSNRNLLKEKEEEKNSQEIENRLQHVVLDIKNKYGKNAIVKAMNLEEGATTIERNQQIGGHKG